MADRDDGPVEKLQLGLRVRSVLMHAWSDSDGRSRTVHASCLAQSKPQEAAPVFKADDASIEWVQAKLQLVRMRECMCCWCMQQHACALWAWNTAHAA